MIFVLSGEDTNQRRQSLLAPLFLAALYFKVDIV
jgi:hypothetical protein